MKNKIVLEVRNSKSKTEQEVPDILVRSDGMGTYAIFLGTYRYIDRRKIPPFQKQAFIFNKLYIPILLTNIGMLNLTCSIFESSE